MAGAAWGRTPELNGFPLESRRIDVGEVRAGGPSRDGIPALDAPAFVPAALADWDDQAIVIGVALGGEARAYPLPVLVWHELVNDELGGVPILVSYCPLCGTGIVFDRRVGPREHRFGVSGLLYRSDLLLYDRETESLWSQILAEAVTGSSEGQRLEIVTSRMLPWKLWRERYPETTVLTTATGHRRNYAKQPYANYAHSAKLLFPTHFDRRYHPKTRTLGLRTATGAARAYPAEELLRAGGRVEEDFAGVPIAVAYDSEARSFEWSAPEGVEAIEGFWFAWSAFHPKTSVYSAPESDAKP